MAVTPNPYESPASADVPENWWHKLTKQLFQRATPKEPRFVDGVPILHYGVAFFVDPNDPTILHAALPSFDATDGRMKRNVAEVLRVLPDFVFDNQDLHSIIRGRRLVVRMIDTYKNLGVEKFSRTELGTEAVDAAINSSIRSALNENLVNQSHTLEPSVELGSGEGNAVVTGTDTRMLTTARIHFDRDYFELHYDDWLAHRAKWRKYEIWCATALTLFGIVMSLAFQRQWLVGAVFACFGVYEFVAAITHRRRWINERLKSIREDKTVDIDFAGGIMSTKSTQGSSVVRLASYSCFTPATNGFFLVPDTGVSIYIPRNAIHPPAAYTNLVESLSSIVGSASKQ